VKNPAAIRNLIAQDRQLSDWAKDLGRSRREENELRRKKQPTLDEALSRLQSVQRRQANRRGVVTAPTSQATVRDNGASGRP
jgi:hypothetical protein